MSFTRCRNCNGQKKVVAMGGFKKECTECLGVGYVEFKSTEQLKRVPRKKKEIVKEEG